MAEEAGDLARVHGDMQIVHRHLAHSAAAVHLGQADDLHGLARHHLGRGGLEGVSMGVARAQQRMCVVAAAPVARPQAEEGVGSRAVLGWCRG